LALLILGCGGKPDKATVQKRVQESLSAASPDWKDINYDTRANDVVSAVTANREVKGASYSYSFTGGGGSGGVGINQAGKWLVKYRYEKGKEVAAEKMEGTDTDLETFRATALEYAMACIKACP
jgi:hypothetical protein